MAVEMEVKFRMDREAWQEIKRDYEADNPLDHVERQSNQYYDTLDRRLSAEKVGLRLRLLEDRTILTIKRDTKEAHKRQELEENYPAGLERLPVESQALQDLLADLNISYDDLAPLVMLRTERSIYILKEGDVEAEVCFDDVSIIGRCREHKLYEVEFELLNGSEERLLQIVQAFQNKYGGRVQQSSISKLGYAMQLVDCE